ncbi:hypothetical protein P873_08800 [Arenimonas composti TR7-09 = DSM 18010]|uniref:Uncharacterized protein n=1 Tax=Arenimonas composti TR7-09 = DSM 18010 TaxID=1121013 RepID=A0A091BEL5_9GAMM|nr:hypothetical protein P873_08800 [Arenimonas composti TR7-09 = DSM 18010]
MPRLAGDAHPQPSAQHAEEDAGGAGVVAQVGGSCTSTQASRRPRPETSSTKASSSGPQRSSRASWVIVRGNFTVKRKSAGTFAAQRA